MANILVAGASGAVGKAILAELNHRSHNIRALVRDKSKLGAAASLPHEIFIADARDPAALNGVGQGIDTVISALGGSLQLGRTKDRQATYWDVDFQANKNLLAEARQAGVRKFIYVSVFKAAETKGIAYFDAHAAFEQELKNSGLDFAIVRPTGIFYIFAEFIKLAARGIIPLIGDGSARTNPIHEHDVARVCVDAITSNTNFFDVGGPEIFTRRAISELCFKALTKKPRFIKYPVRLLRIFTKPTKLFDRRLYQMLEFGIVVGATDFVAPAMGSNRLENYLQQLTAGRQV